MIDQVVNVLLAALVAAISAAIVALGVSLASGETPQTAATYALYAGLTAGTSIALVQLPKLIGVDANIPAPTFAPPAT